MTQETNDVLEAAEQLETQAKFGEDEKISMRRAYTQELEQLRNEIASLSDENSRYLELIIRHSKQKADISTRAHHATSTSAIIER
jgi:hypothetical protein